MIIKCKNRRLTGINKSAKRKNRQDFLKRKSLIQNNLVTNLSNSKLTLNQLYVLNKGLSFVPSFLKPKSSEIDSDIKRFERKLQLHLFFHKKGIKDNKVTENVKLQKNSRWWPKRLNGHITLLCYNLKKDIHKLLQQKSKPNLTKSEFKALMEIKRNESIIIKKADKGGGIAVMDKKQYIDKIYAMLEDPLVYTKIDRDDTKDIKCRADEIVYGLHSEGLLNKKQKTYLVDFDPKCPVFYGIPKIHKKNWPLRPIVSQINGPTYKINELVDLLLATAEAKIPDLLRDTTAFLNVLDQNKYCSDNTYLVTMDIVSLYTNIPHEEGADWVSTWYQETLNDWNDTEQNIIPISKDDLKELILFILKNCTFKFDKQFYKQNYGTTMGAKFSVKFANIYMYMWFREHLSRYNGKKPENISRFIDDCFFKWQDTETELLNFLMFLNQTHTSIKFEFQYSKDKVNFLDTLVYIERNVIKTSLYTKPTDRKQYLHFQSGHPFHVKKAIPFAQALRLRRIIVDDDILKSSIVNLKQQFKARGYPNWLISQQINRINSIDRKDTLVYKTKQSLPDNFLPFVIQYHDIYHTGKLYEILKLRWQEMIASNKAINDVFKDLHPQIVYKRGTTIANLIVRSETSSLESSDRSNVEILVALLSGDQSSADPAVQPCKNKKCHCCRHIIQTSEFFDAANKNRSTIVGKFSCNSRNIIYMIKCLKCSKLYIGQTGRTLRDRLNNHRSDILLNKNTTIAKHFNEPQHSIKHLGILPIFDLSNSDMDTRLKIEKDIIKTLNTSYPTGLNYYPLL